MELARQASWSDTVVELWHYRTRDQVEVDAVLENRRGQVVAVELLGPRVLPGGVAGGPDYAITSADAGEGGLTMAVRIPLGALAGTAGGQPCDTTG
jgi:hypothetical protein